MPPGRAPDDAEGRARWPGGVRRAGEPLIYLNARPVSTCSALATPPSSSHPALPGLSHRGVIIPTYRQRN